MNQNLQTAKPSQEDRKKAISDTLLRVWSGIEPSYLKPPKNAQEVFSVYSRHMNCSYEETLDVAAEALLGQWREENQ